MLGIDSDLPTVPSDILFSIKDFPVTNSMLAGALMTLIIVIFLIFVQIFVKKSGNEKPGKFQIVLEMMHETFLGFIEKIAGNAKIARKIFPIIGTVFIYIGISNVLTLLPFIDSITYNLNGETVPLFRTHTSDINTTFGIAAAMIIWTQIYSIQKNSILGHLNKYFKFYGIYQGFKKGVGPGFISIIEFFVGLLDIISEFAKSISLSLRLFGNMFSGLMLSGIILGALAIIAPVPLVLYGFFSGALQALVFGALTSSYFGSAMSDE